MSYENKAYEKIQKQVKLKKGFFLHFGIYCIVIAFLFCINYLTEGHGPKDWWFLFPAASWGVAIAIHALGVFVFSSTGILGEDWEQRQIESAMRDNNLSLGRKPFSKEKEIDIAEHLDLREIEKKSTYDERDLV